MKTNSDGMNGDMLACGWELNTSVQRMPRALGWKRCEQQQEIGEVIDITAELCCHNWRLNNNDK